MPLVVQVVLLAIFFVWLAILTYFFYTLRSHYNNLTKDTNKKTLTSVLESLTGELDLAKKDIAKLADQCVRIEQEGQFHIQKIGLLRFNPFKDTGGDQSFILALLNAQDTGVVISGLYSRSGTRWYAKKIEHGKGTEHDLSEEEKKVLSLAKPIGK